ncbi:hypothetical protein GLAREA_05871 [Glarea lozoyensis ATCC 20868]|uniref:Heterokaryon incompatibility domain-containing protein n=1 Tax=Glarea lozoyensis (strain ATCC 20868 / MF5171) TaxID=1116229 RepID=S3D6W7_GLAL2|nr:uncharacterized protein GLAREA_05871 [Glarea lozoyensis ATCC 20868]EPE32859.1 hypothetical protein GLAREA_05871 [Glarea lozoyensis ATCC 20868]
MSLVCSPSAAAFTLTEADLLNLVTEKRNKKLLERHIDIQIDCELTLNAAGNTQVHLKATKWSGSNDLCGSCPCCILIVDGLQRELRNSGVYNHFESIIGPVKGGSQKTLCFKYKLRKLEYHRDPSAWQIDGVTETTWDLHLALLRGTLFLAPRSAGVEIGQKPIGINVAFELFGVENDELARVLKLHRRPLASTTLSNSNVAKIQTWIADCETAHNNCFSPNTNVFLPTRLLELDNPHCGDGVKLILSADIVKTGAVEAAHSRYMALSYCWGPPEGWLTTNLETLSTRLSLIALDSMPLAFRDAIRLARILDIRYLWIDSLCIIQDDKEDWEIESSKMAEIFSNAYLTVVASYGATCNESFLRRAHMPKSCTVPVKLSNGINGKFGLRYRRHGLTDKMAEFHNGKWVSRGWTFQEERLAKRVLMFGENKFFFDCKTSEKSEDTDRSRKRPDWVTTVQDKSTDDRYRVPRPVDTNSQVFKGQTYFDHWQTLCSHYSHRELSFASDKLPAISGIAKQTAKRVNSEYLAGLWRMHLMHDLFWNTKCLATRPDVYRAPSWSWASVEGHIAWPTWRWCGPEHCEQFMQILEAKTVVDGADPYGAVKDGYLKIVGKTVEIDRPTAADMMPSSREQTWHALYRGQSFTNARLDTAIPDGEGGDKLYALLAAKCKMKKAQNPVPRGLLLEKADTIRQDGLPVFRRVGVFRVNDGEGNSPGAWQYSENQTLVII